MAQVIALRDPTPASLDECVEELAAWGFDPSEEGSLFHAANWLKRLGNNPDFLGDTLIGMLAGRGTDGAAFAAREPGVNRIMLAPPDRGDFMISADIWPSIAEHALRASGEAALGYGVAHNKNFDFLRLGYFGPGYYVDDYEFDADAVSGWQGKRVKLRPLGRSRMKPGHLVHYRARRDVYCQHPPEVLSVTLTISHTHLAQRRHSHYTFEPLRAGSDTFRIAEVLGDGPSEAFLRVAVALGGEEAHGLARDFGKGHASDRMRLAAWRALAGAASTPEARDAVWREAEKCGSRAVAEVAKRQRTA